MVYSDSAPAVLARSEMDHFVFEESEIKELFLSLMDSSTGIDHQTTELFNGLKRTVIRVYFGPKTTIATSKPTVLDATCEAAQTATSEQAHGQQEGDRLKPPSLEKNFLISPPGSPPVGWTQVVEDAPNQKDLADDLCQRLRFLSVGEEEDELAQAQTQEEEEEEDNDDVKGVKFEGLGLQQPASLKEIVILPAQPARHLPALTVQQIQASKRSPGMGIHLVKATIESMLVSAGNQISRTPRPEI